MHDTQSDKTCEKDQIKYLEVLMVNSIHNKRDKISTTLSVFLLFLGVVLILRLSNKPEVPDTKTGYTGDEENWRTLKTKK